MNYNHLNTFFNVVTQGSFVKASQKLGISQPAVSSSIKKLEDEVGSTLLERSNRGILLTPAGEKVFETSRSIFNQLEGLKADLGVSKETVQGELRIGTSDEIASYLLAKKISSLKDEFPLIMPQIYTAPADELLKKLKRGELDMLILFYTPELPEGVSENKIRDVQFKMVVSSKDSRKKSVLNRFIGSRILQISRINKFPALLKHRKDFPKAQVYLTTNNINMHLQMTLQGHGVSVLPRFMVDPLIDSKKLKDIYPREEFNYGLKVVMRNSFVPNRAFKKLVTLL